jgi:HTH-type transcriptional regulator/antitoxin HigA
MEQRGLSRNDLEKFIGGRGRVAEVLSGKRRLTLAMIRRLHTGLGVPADVLIRQA